MQPVQEGQAAGRMQHPGSTGGGISSITQRLLGGLGGTNNNSSSDNLLQANLYAMAQLEPTPIASHHTHSMTNVVPRFRVQDDQNLLSMDQNLQFSDSLRPLLPTSSMSFQPQAQPTNMFHSGDDAVGGALSGSSVQGHVGAPGQFGARIDTGTASQLPPQNILQHPSAITMHQPFLSLDETIGIGDGAAAGFATNSSNANNTSGGQQLQQQHRHHNLFLEEGIGAGALTKIDHPMLLESILSSNPRSDRIGSSATTGIGRGRRSSSSSDRGDEMKQVSPPLKRKLYVNPSTATSESKRSSASSTTTHESDGQQRPVDTSTSNRRTSRGRRRLNDTQDDAPSAGVAAAAAAAAASVAASAAATHTRAARARPKGISTTSSPQRFRSYQNEQWNMKFQELCEYRRQHGNCNVPSSYDRGLSKWVKRQRYQYKLKYKKTVQTPATSGGDEDASSTTSTNTATTTSTLTDERQEALERIGFVWHSHESAWEERYEELCNFYNANGHCNVPTLYPENTALPLWLQSQRRQYRLYMKGERSFMTEERIAKLSSIGFIFTPRGAGGTTTTRQSSVSSSSSTT